MGAWGEREAVVGRRDGRVQVRGPQEVKRSAKAICGKRGRSRK
jgi:hypothetical protein